MMSSSPVPNNNKGKYIPDKDTSFVYFDEGVKDILDNVFNDVMYDHAC